jgi:RNA polymerase sigma-70 factor, ECF subfamily
MLPGRGLPRAGGRRRSTCSTHDDLGYLLRALRNTFLSGRRATARRPRAAGADPEALDLPHPHTGAAEPLVAAEAREVFAAIAALPADLRDALVAVDVAGLSYGEAANALRVRGGTIGSRLFRARDQIAKSLSPLADHGPETRRQGRTQ